MGTRAPHAFVAAASAGLWLTAPSSGFAQERVPIDIEPVVSELPAAQSEDEDKPVDLQARSKRIDTATAAQVKECEDALEAGEISGEIVVCRRLENDNEHRFSGSHEAWLKDYAERTQGFNTIPAPDVAGAGIFRGAPTFGGMCFLPPCPTGPALIVDFEALPDAPAGSDADRIARGLPPLGQDEQPSEEELRKRREALGLPPPAFEKKDGK